MSDSPEYACPLFNRSDSLREALLETPTAECIQSRIATIKDVSGQFVEDVNEILEKCGSSYYVVMVLCELSIDLAKQLKGEKEIITVDAIKAPNWNIMPDFKCVDSTHIFHTILSRELPPERIGALINLKLATRSCATIEEIEDSLRYLYGSGPYNEIPNIPPLPSKDLTAVDIENAKINGITFGKLKSMIDLRPQVIEDISAMFEAFPHDNVVTQFLYSFITDLIEELHGDTAKIDALAIQEYSSVEVNDLSIINAIESIFSTRLAEENYCELIKLMRAFTPNTEVEDIEKALEYLYGPKDDAA